MALIPNINTDICTFAVWSLLEIILQRKPIITHFMQDYHLDWIYYGIWNLKIPNDFIYPPALQLFCEKKTLSLHVCCHASISIHLKAVTDYYCMP